MFYFKPELCELYGLIGGKNDPTLDVRNIGFIRLNDQQFNLKDIDHKARGINVIRVDAQSCEIQASKLVINLFLFNVIFTSGKIELFLSSVKRQ